MTKPKIRSPKKKSGTSGKKGKKGVKGKVFEGGDNGRLVGSYIPVVKLKKMMAPEEVNDLYAKKMGFASAEEMRATYGWRNVIKEARAKNRAREEE